MASEEVLIEGCLYKNSNTFDSLFVVAKILTRLALLCVLIYAYLLSLRDSDLLSLSFVYNHQVTTAMLNRELDISDRVSEELGELLFSFICSICLIIIIGNSHNKSRKMEFSFPQSM